MAGEETVPTSLQADTNQVARAAHVSRMPDGRGQVQGAQKSSTSCVPSFRSLFFQSYLVQV